MDKDDRSLVCGAGGFIGGHLIGQADLADGSDGLAATVEGASAAR
jgi:hypothetical protein